MITRNLQNTIDQRLDQFPAVAILGPRQVGKMTLAHQIGSTRPSHYLDLENPADREKLRDPVHYLSSHEDKLVILDEVQRMPELFQILRGLIDQQRRKKKGHGQYLLLGSASGDLLQQSGESLAGRIAYTELGPLDIAEVPCDDQEELWVRGGFPDSFLATSDEASSVWRENFIRTYLERDIPQLGPRIPAETLRRFWTMLAHTQGGLLNAAALARGLAVSGKTIARYLDLLVDLMLVRRLLPYHVNAGKRLVKSPKVFLRDSGTVHSLLGLDDREAVLGHPVVGGSWEGFVVENILRSAPFRTQASFYRTAAGAEIDLVLELPGDQLWAIEIKRGLSPSLDRGFHEARQDLMPARAFVVYGGQERYTHTSGCEFLSLEELCADLRN